MANQFEPDGQSLSVRVNDRTTAANEVQMLKVQPRSVRVKDRTVVAKEVQRLKALKGMAGSIGAAMPGVVLETKVKRGDSVKKRNPLVLMLAMKMETVITSPCDGVVKQVVVTTGDQMDDGDLCVEIDEA